MTEGFGLLVIKPLKPAVTARRRRKRSTRTVVLALNLGALRIAQKFALDFAQSKTAMLTLFTNCVRNISDSIGKTCHYGDFHTVLMG